MFAVPTRKFGKYQLTKAVPWWFRRWVLFDRDAKLEPLYTFDQPDREVSEGVRAEEVTGTEKSDDVTGTEKKAESD